jgi:hypothetical protein
VLGSSSTGLSRAEIRRSVVLHGGHMHAGIALGKRLRNLGYGVLVASRPGYGRTPGDRRPVVLGANTARFRSCSLPTVRADMDPSDVERLP